MATSQAKKPHHPVLTAAKAFTILQGVLLLAGSTFFVLDALRAQDSPTEAGWFFIVTMLLVLLLLPPTILLWVFGLYAQRQGQKSATAPLLAVGTVGLLALVVSVFTSEFFRSVATMTTFIFLGVTIYLIGKQVVQRYELEKHASSTLITVGLLVVSYGITALILGFADTIRQVINS